jgi:hypothetical protein
LEEKYVIYTHTAPPQKKKKNRKKILSLEPYNKYIF